MALSIETLRNSIITSLFGRRLGLDVAGYLVGAYDNRLPVTDLTSASTATAIPPYGITNITGTSLATSAAGGAFLLSNPVPGVETVICNLNANTSAASPGSTAMQLIRPSTAFYLISSEGSTETTINITPGSAVTLAGLSTSAYAVIGRTTLAGVVINGTT